MIRKLLFDADGVLFFHTDKLFSERIIADYGSSPNEVQNFFETVFPDCIVNKKDLKRELSVRMRDWGWPGTVEELMQYWFEYEHKTDQPLIDYVRQARYAGVQSYVATNNDHYRASSLFRHLNLDESVFSKLYAAGDFGVAKPDHAFFQQIIDDLGGASKQEILFWDDSLQNVESAREFGISAELYTTFTDFKLKMEQYLPQ